MIEYINNRFVWKRSTTQGMGRIYADIELLNGFDAEQARRNKISENEIKRFVIRPLVDSGSDHLCINENIQEALQLSTVGWRRVQLANGKIITCDMVGPVELRFRKMRTSCDAIVLPGDSEPLLGLLPLVGLDVIIDPAGNKLIESPHLPRI